MKIHTTTDTHYADTHSTVTHQTIYFKVMPPYG
jgi:hypothetical protein